MLYSLTVVAAVGIAVLCHLFARSPAGVMGEAILSNEIRVEYLGTSVTRILHKTYILGALSAGLGGALVAMATRHIDPELAYWTTSGEFVFVAILSGIGHVAAPLAGMVLFEAFRSFAFQYSPDTWQMVVGLAMLAVILFLPAGLVVAHQMEAPRGRSGMNATVISTKDLQKRFGAVVAADDVSVDIVPGVTVGIIGANGAGKTTFVNMVTGYIKPDSGAHPVPGRGYHPAVAARGDPARRAALVPGGAAFPGTADPRQCDDRARQRG